MNNLGDFTKEADGYRIRLERTYNHSIGRVWDALTDPAKVTHWFTDVEWELKPGSRITFIFQDEQRSRSYGRIVTVEPPRLLEYIWENEEGGPDELARWELFDEGERTRLVLTYSRITVDYAANVATGWHIVVDDLGDFLDGKRDFGPFGGAGLDEAGETIKKEYTRMFEQLS